MARVDYFNDPAAPTANSILPSVTAVVLNEAGELLVVHKTDNNLWALPGGGVDPGESVMMAVVREVKEETGIDVAVGDLVGVYTNPRHVMAYDDGEVRQQFSLCFRAHPTGGELSTSEETKEIAFWPPEKRLADLDIHPSMQLRIDHGLTRPVGQPYIG
jgi:8-oxo-dGTP pyrophosphatase MutT (NUDIX family)